MNDFEREMQNLKDSSSFLFYSDGRISLYNKSLEFARLLLEDNSKNIITNPDLKYYEDIKIDDVRDLILNAHESSYISKRKVYIINNIEKAKKEVLNGLLKIIEEPPKNVYFILLTKRMDILETIKSRTIKINLTKNIPVELLNLNKIMFEFFEYDIEYLKEFLESNIDIEQYSVNNIDELLDYLNSYYIEENLINRIKYERVIEFLVKELKFMKNEETIILKDRLLELISNSKVNKITRERMYNVINSCILKAQNRLKNEKIERLIEYKMGINSNVNIKLIFFLFINILSN
ncbi:hypothetical protein [Pseudostreptobacillus hongkongensis]|uniref:hypothetical protein n=1 Tax=Pseudostreptobacillus hongkongensis TaxID=1162717 RepID=UPI000836DC67|nr:hypothetical protein [Pseudostreptobacillus hongkongensis]